MTWTSFKHIGDEIGVGSTNVRTEPNLSAPKLEPIYAGTVREGSTDAGTGTWIKWKDGGYSRYCSPETGNAMFREVTDAAIDHASSSFSSTSSSGERKKVKKDKESKGSKGADKGE